MDYVMYFAFVNICCDIILLLFVTLFISYHYLRYMSIVFL